MFLIPTWQLRQSCRYHGRTAHGDHDHLHCKTAIASTKSGGESLALGPKGWTQKWATEEGMLRAKEPEMYRDAISCI